MSTTIEIIEGLQCHNWPLRLVSFFRPSRLRSDNAKLLAYCVKSCLLFGSIWVGCASGILLQIARRFRSFISTPEIEDLVSVSLLEIEDSD